MIEYPRKIHSREVSELMKFNVVDRPFTTYRAAKIEPYFDPTKGEPEAPGVALHCFWIHGEIRWMTNA